jgi:hypothetical protein
MSLSLIRYLLVALGWMLAVIALPLQCCELNGFLAWRGPVTTAFFIKWLFQLPRYVIRDFLDPSAAHGAMGGRLTARFDVAGLDLLWLGAVLTGFVLMAAAPVLVHRVRSPRGAITVRCLAPALLLLPLTALAPESWRYPLPLGGMWVLCAAHVVVGLALMLSPFPSRMHPFPIEVKT